ncbi:hypothetical protein GCM10012286_39150 [Streptomyces lasiicapitis]|uniref:Uncharacterized protein n=1 Tax=Streptomyces lasiicapitis TaxID=1923961 RepID=A0ABQ2M547_9ACTN|nr:hypothetical protein GCM10012286_39150 [Streptomyces lasiicapitis]
MGALAGEGVDEGVFGRGVHGVASGGCGMCSVRGSGPPVSGRAAALQQGGRREGEILVRGAGAGPTNFPGARRARRTPPGKRRVTKP